jgi:hypothetical protein
MNKVHKNRKLLIKKLPSLTISPSIKRKMDKKE